MTTNRRLAINAALRELYDEMDQLDVLLGITRTSKTRAIVKRALIAEFHNGARAARGELASARLAYDSEELELQYGGDEHGTS